ncbi:MAG: methyltransferase domain-containing protein [Burkholderiaceae bacterium]|nr:methyltransferase domain-containing protein [Burkholderiaceae bacterium]
MDFYDRLVLPRLVDMACGSSSLARTRALVVPRARGRVLEVGFGSGLNLPFYDSGKVERVLALEPGEGIRALAMRRVAASAVPVEFVGAPGESIPLADASVDSIVITFTLCTIPDVARAAREMRRVLRRGGELLFAEHGVARSVRARRWQRRIEPVWTPLAGGCHLTRDPPQILRDAGFSVEWTEGLLDPRPLAARTIGPLTYGYWGVAR